jgi:hypothetical protein
MPIDPNNPPRYRCLHEFSPKEDGEIRAAVGELFVLSPGDDGIFDTEDDMNDGWLYVTNLASGETGFVPLEYMQEIQETPVQQPQQSSPSPRQQQQPTVPSSSFSPPPVSETKDRSDYSSPTPTSSGPPIRRFSDPRLAEHLLNNIDPKAMEGSPNRGMGDSMPTPNPSSRHQTPSSSRNNTPKFGSTSPNFSFPSSTSRLSSTPKSTSTSPLLAKLKGAGKKVVSSNRLKSVVSGPPRTPALATAVASEDYNELFKRNEDFYRKLTTNRNESFQVLQEMVEQLGKKVQSATQRSNDLVTSLQQLDELIDEERRKWKQQNELERNEAVKGRGRSSFVGPSQGQEGGGEVMEEKGL